MHYSLPAITIPSRCSAARAPHAPSMMPERRPHPFFLVEDPRSPSITHLLTRVSRKITSLVRCAAARFSAYCSLFETANAHPPEGFPFALPVDARRPPPSKHCSWHLTVVASGGPSPLPRSPIAPTSAGSAVDLKPSVRVLLSFNAQRGLFSRCARLPARPAAFELAAARRLGPRTFELAAARITVRAVVPFAPCARLPAGP